MGSEQNSLRGITGTFISQNLCQRLSRFCVFPCARDFHVLAILRGGEEQSHLLFNLQTAFVLKVPPLCASDTSMFLPSAANLDRMSFAPDHEKNRLAKQEAARALKEARQLELQANVDCALVRLLFCRRGHLADPPTHF